jgi:hypothetical protein
MNSTGKWHFYINPVRGSPERQVSIHKAADGYATIITTEIGASMQWSMESIVVE